MNHVPGPVSLLACTFQCLCAGGVTSEYADCHLLTPKPALAGYTQLEEWEVEEWEVDDVIKGDTITRVIVGHVSSRIGKEDHFP